MVKKQEICFFTVNLMVKIITMVKNGKSLLYYNGIKIQEICYCKFKFTTSSLYVATVFLR